VLYLISKGYLYTFSTEVSTFGRIIIKSGFLVAGFGVETMDALGGVKFVDGPSIEKNFGNLVDLFETSKYPTLGQPFCSLYFESLKVSCIVSFQCV
jgi:hypothetical protein